MTTTVVERIGVHEAVEKAAAEVLAQRATLAEWEDRLAAAEREQAAFTGTSGEELLANPGLEVDLADRLNQLKSRIELIRQAVAAQEPRVLVAESRWFAAQADAHEAAVGDARAALRSHEAKTKRLLAELAEHECAYIPKHEKIRSDLAAGVLYADGDPVLEVPKSQPLAAAFYKAQMHVAVLRRLASGGDPADLKNEQPWIMTPSLIPANIYPPCVEGPDALVKAPAFANRVLKLRSHIAELERLARELPVEIADWEARLAQAQDQGLIDADHRPTAAFDARALMVNPGSDDATIVSRAGLLRRCARLETLEDELINTRRALAEMTGEPAGAA